MTTIRSCITCPIEAQICKLPVQLMLLTAPQQAPHEVTMSYDSFSCQVQASSCHSTPAKSPLGGSRKFFCIIQLRHLRKLDTFAKKTFIHSVFKQTYLKSKEELNCHLCKLWTVMTKIVLQFNHQILQNVYFMSLCICLHEKH